MATAVLYPRFDHDAIEERYASWQTQMLLRGGDERVEVDFYDELTTAAHAADELDAEHLLVVVDPLLIPSSHLVSRLRAALDESGAEAVVPVSNEAAHPRQKRAPLAAYLTLRELQETMARFEEQPRTLERVTWDASNPGAFLCRTASLAKRKVALRDALAGREVAISSNDYIHRWSSLRGQTRYDLLDLIDTDAKSILEFGCGEAPLGEALKKRQRCRVVGIELDPHAAAIAQKRIDAVYRGDVREIVARIDERFDWIVGGDIVEHLDEPWSFLAELRRLATPGGHLLLSIPNLANASVINDLLQGRFDYVYMGLTCVGHLRFFTRRSLEDMLTIAGWTVDRIEAQDFGPAIGREQLLSALDAAGVPYSKADLIPSGYYVIARNGNRA
jgi:2-polyprenyl-3-methyl-5-hydroxy-6-metoxy-1,4-benzoquinol methylase